MKILKLIGERKSNYMKSMQSYAAFKLILHNYKKKINIKSENCDI